MGGRKSPKKHGRRKPGKRKRIERKLHFLCERHAGREVREALSALGFAASDPRAYQLPDDASDTLLVRTATEHRMVFLTRDKDDCLDEIKFRPGTHAGILVLDVRPPASQVELRVLKQFLTFHYKHCKGNIVHLVNDAAIVTTPKGRETIRLQSGEPPP